MSPDAPTVLVPFQDMKRPYVELKDEFDAAYQRFMESGWYVLGSEVDGFETEYGAFCEAEHCVGVGHGLDALRLALLACDVGPGDEVIVPSNTYIATWLAVTQVGATIVPVEPDAATFNLDPELTSAALSKKTKVILPVNLYGHPCDYDPIMSIAQDHGIRVVIDNAQAHGARYKGRRVGGIADIECHSFYPTKNLGAFGEAGAITTNTPELADRIRVLRNYGSRVRYENEVLGFNSRLDELQAAFLRIKLKHLDDWNSRRRSIAKAYQQELVGVSDLLVPAGAEWAEHVWHLFVVRHPKRDQLQRALGEAGIQTLVHYPIPPHLSTAYHGVPIGSRHQPVAEELARQVLSLPMGPFLEKSSIERVSRSVQELS